MSFITTKELREAQLMLPDPETTAEKEIIKNGIIFVKSTYYPSEPPVYKWMLHSDFKVVMED